MPRIALNLLATTILLAAANNACSPQPCTGAEPKAPTAAFTEVDVFTSGEDGYDTYRIPSIVKAKNGTLIAFCEARKNGRSDTGNIDLVMKKSRDQGRTWSDQIVVWDDLQNTCGNPCPVVDQSTGKICLLLTWNSGTVHERDIAAGFGNDSRKVYLSTSTDHGDTWSKPTDITKDTKLKSWTWYATGPGAGIQIKNGIHQGRLVIPCDHKEPRNRTIDYYSHVIYSDDGGLTWQLGGRSPEPNTNECELVELTNQQLMLNMRNYRQGAKVRQACLSDDGGKSWNDQRQDEALIEPICQASIRRITWPEANSTKGSDNKGLILFSNPAHKTKRRQMTVRASTDDGQTWPYSKLIYKGDSAYSCLVGLPNAMAGCLYEKDGYRKITLALFSIDWLVTKSEANH